MEESVEAPFGRDNGMTTGTTGFFEDFTRLADHALSVSAARSPSVESSKWAYISVVLTEL